MPDEPYRFRGSVIKAWARRGAEQWQAHHCRWFGVETWPFTERELKRLILIRWLVTKGMIHEFDIDRVATGSDRGIAATHFRRVGAGPDA